MVLCLKTCGNALVISWYITGSSLTQDGELSMFCAEHQLSLESTPTLFQWRQQPLLFHRLMLVPLLPPSRCGLLRLAGVTNFSREPRAAWPLFDDWHADKIHWKQILRGSDRSVKKLTTGVFTVLIQDSTLIAVLVDSGPSKQSCKEQCLSPSNYTI